MPWPKCQVSPSGAHAWLTPNTARAPCVRWGCPAPRQASQVPSVHRVCPTPRQVSQAPHGCWGMLSTEAGAQASLVRLVYQHIGRQSKRHVCIVDAQPLGRQPKHHVCAPRRRASNLVLGACWLQPHTCAHQTVQSTMNSLTMHSTCAIVQNCAIHNELTHSVQ